MFAVIKTGGKQYRVAPEEILKIEKLSGEAGEQIVFSDILLIGEGDKVEVGAPYVKDATVVAEIVKQGRAAKVIAFKKRRRQNSKRTRGHRQHLTFVRIKEISVSGKKSSKKVKEAAAE